MVIIKLSSLSVSVQENANRRMEDLQIEVETLKEDKREQSLGK